MATRKKNAVKRRTTRRTNPVRAKRKTNPARVTAPRRNYSRKANPSTVTGLIGAAVATGVAVGLFDTVLNRVMPGQSDVMRIGIKAGGAFVLQNYGKKIPLLGTYKNEIALVLMSMAAIDAFKLWILPMIQQATGGLLLQPIPMPMADDEMAYSRYQ